MPETPEELFARGRDALRTPPVAEWHTFPFQGALAPRPLEPPVEAEAAREGADGVDCDACNAADGAYLWTTPTWRLRRAGRRTGRRGR